MTEARPLIVGLVTQSYSSGGGVRTVSAWLAEVLRELDVEIRIFELTNTMADPGSWRLLSPLRRPKSLLRVDWETGVTRVGAVGVEIEPCRYLPRTELTRALDECDVLQVVAGSPAVAYAASRSRRPVILQMATLVEWERPSVIRRLPPHRRGWMYVMTPLVSLIERAALAGSRHVLVENPVIQSELAARGVNAHLAPPGIDIERFRPSSGRDRSDPYILSLGRLAEARKGYERMIAAYAALRALDPSSPRLVIAGKGRLDPDVLDLIPHLGLKQWVEVLSDVPDDGLIGLYQGAELFWMTSYEEGLGLAAVEAMACGVPVVATLTAGTAMSVTPEVGALVGQDPYDPDSFAAATVEVLGRRESAAAAARQRAVDIFASPVALAPYLAAYAEALEGVDDVRVPSVGRPPL